MEQQSTRSRERQRWGIVGCGDVARKRVARAILDDPSSELVSVCRRDEEKLRRFREDFDVPRACRSAAELIADPQIDVVYIATPVDLHLPQTIAAATAGKHVLVEKPMAMSVAECDEMLAACRAHGVTLGVAYYRRHYPVYTRIRELVAAGEIGTPLAISCTTATPFAIAPDEDGYWRVIAEQGGGGALMDIGSHRLDLFLDLFGDVDGVVACCDTIAGEYSAEDCASLVLRFSSGVHGSLQCVFGAPVDPDELSILGTRGRLHASTLNSGKLIIDSGDGRRSEAHPPADNFNAPLVADFVAAIRELREPLVSGDDGRRVNDVMERAYRDAAR